MNKHFNAKDLVNSVAISMLLLLVAIGLWVASATVESNALTADVAKLDASHRGKLLREVRLLTLELKMVKSDVEEVREAVKKLKRKEK